MLCNSGAYQRTERGAEPWAKYGGYSTTKYIAKSHVEGDSGTIGLKLGDSCQESFCMAVMIAVEMYIVFFMGPQP